MSHVPSRRVFAVRVLCLLLVASTWSGMADGRADTPDRCADDLRTCRADRAARLDVILRLDQEIDSLKADVVSLEQDAWDCRKLNAENVRWLGRLQETLAAVSSRLAEDRNDLTQQIAILECLRNGKALIPGSLRCEGRQATRITVSPPE